MNNNRNQRFKLICAAADKIVEETGISPSEITGYAVAQAAFGKKPNGDFYVLFEEWLKHRRVIPGAPLADMPAEATAQLEEWTDHVKAQIMQRVTVIVRGIAGSFAQTMAMRVEALERLFADQARRNLAVIATLVETEAELDRAQASIVELTDDLKQERNHVQRLLGRLDERDALLKALTSATATDRGSSVSLPDEGREHAAPDGSIDGERQAGGDSANAASPAPIAVVDQPFTANVSEPKQPSVVETNRPIGSQDEMPLVTSADANETNIGDDDNG